MEAGPSLQLNWLYFVYPRIRRGEDAESSFRVADTNRHPQRFSIRERTTRFSLYEIIYRLAVAEEALSFDIIYALPTKARYSSTDSKCLPLSLGIKVG